MKKAVLKNFAIFTGKLQTCNFIKKRHQHSCFSSEWWRTPANSCFWFFKTATEHREEAASALTPLLSSDNLLTGYEQLHYQQFNQNLSICVSLTKDWFMLHKKLNEDLATYNI